uniref:hypothetical protein n=1 Tax=Alistipes sp. TaxID=1872444 RepID=UPI004056B84C
MPKADGETADMVMGLKLGADDYIMKPYALRHVVARIKSLLRRTSSNKGATTRTESTEMPSFE